MNLMICLNYEDDYRNYQKKTGMFIPNVKENK